MEKELRDFGIRKYGTLSSVKEEMDRIKTTIEMRDLKSLYGGISELPQVRCTACGSYVSSSQYDKYRQLIEMGMRSEDIFDKLGMRYCCRMNVTNPIIIQFSLMNNDIVEKEQSLNSKDIIKLGVTVVKNGTKEIKHVKDDMEILDLPLLESEATETEEEIEPETITEKRKERMSAVADIDIEQNHWKEVLPNWEKLDIGKRNTLMENYLDTILKEIERKKYSVIYPDWDFISVAEREKRKKERREKIIELSKADIWDISPDEVKKNAIIDRLLEMNIDVDEDIEDESLDFLIEKMDEVSSDPDWRNTILLLNDREEAAKKDEFEWKPKYWNDFSAKDKYSFLEGKIKTYIEEKLIPLTSNNWKNELVEIKRNELKIKHYQYQMQTSLDQINTRISKIIEDPRFYEEYYQEMEMSSGNLPEKKLRTKMFFNAAEKETVEKHKEGIEYYKTTKFNQGYFKDELVDVGAGYSVRVMKRRYKAD